MTGNPLRLRELRVAAGLTQVQLAKRAGVREASIVKFERGGTTRTIEMLEKLAGALGVGVRELFAHAPPPPKRRPRR